MPRLTYLARTGARSIVDKNGFIQMLQRNFNVTVIDHWGGHNTRTEAYALVKRHLQILADTDILIGMHGAALAYTAFLKPGSHVVELRSDFSCEKHLFAHMAFLQNSTHQNIDVQTYAQGQFWGYTDRISFPDNALQLISDAIMEPKYTNIADDTHFCSHRSFLYNLVAIIDHSSNEIRRWIEEPCYNAPT